MGLNDRNNDSQTFGSTWTVETNVSANPEDLSSRGIGLQGKFCMYLYFRQDLYPFQLALCFL